MTLYSFLFPATIWSQFRLLFIASLTEKWKPSFYSKVVYVCMSVYLYPQCTWLHPLILINFYLLKRYIYIYIGMNWTKEVDKVFPLYYCLEHGLRAPKSYNFKELNDRKMKRKEWNAALDCNILCQLNMICKIVV